MSNRYTIGKFGTISDIKKGFARVKFEDDDIVSNWLPVMVRKSLTDKESWPYEVNEHVFCMMDENCEYGIIQGAIYSDADAPDDEELTGKFRMSFSDGSFIEYNKNDSRLTVDIKGDIIVKSTTLVRIEAPEVDIIGNVVVTGTITASDDISSTAGDVVVTGTITATGDISSTGGDVIAGTKHLKTHVHSGVTTGSGNTGAPV